MKELILVLNGGGFHKKGEIDPHTRSSLDIASQYWRANGEPLVVVTGGHLYGDTRFSSAMKGYLVELDIPSNCIEEERTPSLDTAQNIQGVLPIIKEVAPDRIVLIAPYNHLIRAGLQLQAFLSNSKILAETLLIPSTPPAEITLWERVARIFATFDPMGKSVVYRFVRWLMFKKYLRIKS